MPLAEELSVILCDRADIDTFTAQGAWGETTLDGLLARAASTRAHAPALAAWADGRWTEIDFAALQGRVDALARLLLASGLRQDDVVAYQLPNGIDAYVTLLAVLRAQGIACPLPLTWRERELSNALAQVNARIVITCDEYGGHTHADMMRFVAAEIFSVRRILGFGDALPDGVESIAALSSEISGMDLPAPRREAANHIATFCFDMAADQLRPIARSHNEWLAAAKMPLAALKVSADDCILTAHYPTHFAALACAFAPWLLSGCRLALVDPLDFPLSSDAAAASKASVMLAPQTSIAPLVASGRLPGAIETLSRLGVVWQAAAFGGARSTHLEPVSGLETVDLVCFGEAALMAQARQAGGSSNDFKLGAHLPAGSAPDSPALLTLRLDGADGDALHINGPMLPSATLGAQDNRISRIGLAQGREFRTSGLAARLTGDTPAKARLAAETGPVLTVAGMAIWAGELDQLLCEHSGVSDAAAFTVPHKVLGATLCAAIVPEDGRTVTLEDMRTFLSVKRVALHKLPEQVAIVAAIPRDAQHNVLRAKLAETG